jgi:hypothetical protein
MKANLIPTPSRRIAADPAGPPTTTASQPVPNLFLSQN